MSYTLSNLISFVNYRIGDSSGGTVDSNLIAEYANEALRRMRRKFEIPPSTRRQEISLFKGVYRYGLPTGTKDVITITGQDDMPDDYNFERTSASDFWRAYLNHNRFSDERNGNSRDLLVRLTSPQLTDVQLSDCGSLTANGTWAILGDATNMRLDSQEYRSGSSSIAFDVTPSANYAGLTLTGMTAVDTSSTAIYQVGTAFLWVYLPSYTSFTTVTLRWGKDSSNYWSKTATTQYSGAALTTGWNQLGFDWASATKTGSPTSAISYLQVRFDYPGTMTAQYAIRIDDIRMKEAKKVWLKTTSDYLVVDGTNGAFKEAFTSGTDNASYLACDSAFTDWIWYSVLESTFTYSIKDQDARALNQALLAECEKSLLETSPSEKPPISYAYIDTDDLADYL